MVFVSQNRMRSGRGRGRGIGEVSFQSGNPERDGGARTDFESRPPAAGELRITVGNDKYRENNSGNNPYGQRQGPGPGYDSHRGRGGQYGRDADLYNAPGRPDSNNRGSYQSQEGYGRDYEREAGDRRGFGASQGPGTPQSQHSFGTASRAVGQSYSGPPPTSSASSTSASAASSRPLKSILKKKNEPAAEPQSNTSQKPSGLPGMSNYLDDIDDEDKFLYGEDNDHKHAAEHVQQKSHRNPGLDIKSAAQAWKPSAPSNTVSGIVSDFVSSQRSYSDRQSYPQTQASSQYSQAPSSASNQAGGGDLWSMLAKSVQTVQSQQPPVQQDIYGTQQQSMYQSTPAQSVQAQVEPPQSAQSSDSGHDPTIENILKSIGFDFDMSKRMQEKAKQAAGEVVPPKPPKTEESQFGINQAASFLGSDMSQDMRSSLGLQDQSRDGDRYRRDSASRDYSDRDRRSDRRSEEYDDMRDRRDSSDRKRDRDYDDNRGDSHDRKRGRSFDDNSNDAHDRYKSSYDMFSSPAKTTSQSIPARDLSPVSDEGSPPPPMFNLPPITIKRKTGLDRNRSPGWEQRRSPERTIQIKRSSRSPSFTRSISSFGKRSNRSRSNSQDRDAQPRKNSPIIRRTIMISPDFRKKMDKSPLQGKRPSPSPGGRGSPGRRSSRSPGRSKNKSPGRGKSPGKRRSLSPVKRRSPSPKRGRSPGRDRSPRKRSRSPRKRSRSPRRRSKSPRRRSRSPRRRSRSPRKRSRSPRRRSRSPRGTKRSRSPRGSSRDRKMRRSRSGDRFRSPGHVRRSRSGSRGRGRSLSPESVDSDIDGPANKEYFSSPLRMPGRPPRFYNNPPGGPPMPGPPPNFGPPPGPPMMFGQGPPPGPMGAPPPFGMPPPFSVPPPAMAPGPPNYGSQLTYIVPTEPPPVMDPSVPPPGTFNTPHLLPTQPVDLPEVPGEERRQRSEQRDDKDTKDTRDDKKDDSRRDRSSSHERRIVISKPKTSASKFSSSSDKKDSDKKPVDKAKILKEREDFDKKIKILQSEFENLKKLEEELKANTKMTKENETILEENSKLRDEIKKELTKLDKDKKAFETKHSSILKDVIAKETPSKRQITVTKKTDAAKKSNERKDTKDDKKDAKSESQFKVEKGKLMKHQFVDNGGHWCKSCNVDFSNIHDYVQHLPTYKHKQSIPTDFRPWKEGFQPNEGMIVNKNGIRVPLPGIEFMYPVTAYYCKLCKVFLGDVSSGVDHFRCENHYINYQAYCKDNPYHEKKMKEDKDAFYKKKSEDKKQEKRDRDSSKLTSSEVREKERQKKQETDSKSRDSRRRSDDDRRSRDGDSRSSSSQKSGGLPPWQSVSQKVEEPSKSSLDSFLTTNTDGGKVPVVVDKKKKVSGQEVLKAFNEKKKLKEQQEREAKEKELEAKLEEERKEREALQLQLEALKNEQELKIQLETKKNKREIEELKNKLAAKDDKLQVEDMEIDEEAPGEIKDLKMMGIDPHSITPLYDIKPPPPRTQNIPHPDQKAHSTVSGSDVHNLFFGNKPVDRKKAPKPSPNDLADIPLPGGSPVKKPEGPKKHWKVFFEPIQDEKPKETESKTDIDEVKEEQKDIDNDEKEVQNDNIKDKAGEEEKPVVHIEIEIENDKDSKSDNQLKLEQENESVMKVDEETDRFKCEVKVDIMDDKETTSNETDDKDVVEKEEESSVVKVDVEMNDSPASLRNENEMKVDNVEEKEKDNVEIKEKDNVEIKEKDNSEEKEKDNCEEKEKDNSEEKAKDNVEMKEKDNVDAKESDVTKDADKDSEDIINVKEGTPEDEEVTPRGKRGGKRGRGRGRGKGRGRGARGASKRSTRATRSNIDTEQQDESIETSAEPSQEIQDSGNDAEPKVVETESTAPAEEQEISIDIPVSSGTDEKLSEITDNEKETETLNANNTTSENTTQSEVSTELDDNAVKSNDDIPQTDINTEPENALQEALQSGESETADKDPPSVKDESESAPSEGIEMKSDIVQEDQTEHIDLDIANPLPETEAITEPIAKSSPVKPKRGARGRPKKSTAKSKTQDDSDSVTKTIELINELNKQSEDATVSEGAINDSKSNDSTKPSETLDNSFTLEVGKSPGKGRKRKTRSNVKPKDTTSEIDIDNQPVLDLNLLDPENPLDTNYSEMIEMEEGPVSFDMPTSSSSLENVNVEINMIGADSSTVEVNVTNENSSVLNVKNKEKEYDVLLSGVNILEDNSSSFDFGSPVKVQRVTSREDKGKASDNDDNASEHSGISMHISSDFEVVDDIDDLADVLPLS